MNRYLLTENDLGEHTSFNAISPVRLFTLDGLGVPSAVLIGRLDPTFSLLPWDLYDVRRGQVELIALHSPSADVSLLERYYRGVIGRDALHNEIASLPTGAREAFESLRPFRRRALSTYAIAKQGTSFDWSVRLEANQPFLMGVADKRRIPREFPQIDASVATCGEVLHLLKAIANVVWECRNSPPSLELRVIMHQMSIVARKGFSANNSPEGIHQDGADYIVSALVVSRTNVTGGTSRVFYGDRRMALLRRTLRPGEGLFQADAGSALWHDVTPIALKRRGACEEGTRNILGLDIHVGNDYQGVR